MSDTQPMPSTPESQVILAPRLFDGDGWLDDHCVIVENGHIVAVLPNTQSPANLPRLTLDEGFLCPGFIDLQVNGGGGVLFNNDPTPSGIAAIAEAHRSYGTTSLLPTLISDTAQKQRMAVEAVQSSQEAGNAAVLGIHLEGPFLNAAKRGTHRAQYIRPPEPADIQWLTEELTVPLLLTLAPETLAPGQVRSLAEAGIRVCAGHTDASYPQLAAAIDEGLLGFTHLFNAMSPLTSRAPGAVGAALDSDNTWAGIIADGHHVDPASIRIAQRAKAKGKLFLVSDAMATVGSADKTFELYGERIEENNGRLVNAEGKLAGSAIGMIDAVRVCLQQVGLPLEECLRMASLYPASFLGLQNQLGRIAPGQRADLVHLSDDLLVRQSWVRGDTKLHWAGHPG